MWELNDKESWALKNLCVWTVVLETIESPLDCKEIQPVHPKGNQPRIFIGRTDGEVEAPILWPSDVNSQFTGKYLDAWKDWRQKVKRVAEDEMVRQHHWLQGHEFEQTLRDSREQRSLVCCSSWGCRVGHDLATEQAQKINALFSYHYYFIALKNWN